MTNQPAIARHTFRRTFPTSWRLGVGCRQSGAILGALLALFSAGGGAAQVVLDGKFGSSGPISGPNFNITAALGTTRGNNLFHSFTQFDLKAGDVATFSGPANIQNILSRVTGGNPSSIDGTIRSDIPGANLFLINPQGVLFGPNAAVDVSGAFAVSSANYLKLQDGARFTAALDADDSKLSSAPVAAFGFLDGANGSIEVRGALKAGSGSSLSVVGSTVTATDGAHLEAINGQISLFGAAAPGEVPFPPPSSASGTSASAGTSSIQATAPPANSGNIVIRGGRLVVNNALVSATTTGGEVNISLTEGLEVVNGGQITTSSSGAVKGGNIVVNTPSVLVDGQDGLNPTRIAAESSGDDPQATGGNVVVKAQTVDLRRGAEISVSTSGAADAGQVEITTSVLSLYGADIPFNPTQLAANAATTIGGKAGAGGGIVVHADTINIDNGGAIQANTQGDANAGKISINAGSLTILNGSIATSTAYAGQGGEIAITSDHLVLDGPFSSITAVTTGVNSPGSAAGNGGVVNINAGKLELRNDSGISATTYGDGKGGDVRINADNIVLDNATFQPGAIPGITAASKPPFFGEGIGGQGGDISVTAKTLTMSRGMTISASTSTAGAGGNVNISAGLLTMDGQSSIQSASFDQGPAGTLTVQSATDLVLTGGSSINTSALQSSGGNINVRSGHEVRLYENSQITAQAGPGGGGSIDLRAPQMVYLLDSTLTAQAVGDGGNLTIDPIFIILNRGNLISKSASANGGNISILSDYFFQSDTVIDASAPFGIPGTVTVTAPQIDLSGSLIALPANLLSLETQLRPDCGIRLSGNVSSFIVVGRGGLLLAPGGFVPSGETPPLDDVK